MQFTVTREDAGLCVRQYLAHKLTLSHKMLKYLKYRPDGILVNGAPATVRHILEEGDTLSLATEDSETPPHLIPVDLPIEILYEDDDLVVPAKPADMPTHPSHDHWDDTVANALAYRYAQAGLPFVFRPINRLDRNTSGLLLVARNKMSAGTLTQAMQSGNIRKTYLAVLDGEMDLHEGEINACLHRTASSIIVREVCSPDEPDADEAYTRYCVLASSNGHSLVLAQPVTGRTHQLRVHFASIGHAITGDDLYGSPSPHIPRHALHAYTLSFPHPTTQERMSIKAPLPSDFLHLTSLFFPNFDLCLEGKDILK